MRARPEPWWALTRLRRQVVWDPAPPPTPLAESRQLPILGPPRGCPSASEMRVITLHELIPKVLPFKAPVTCFKFLLILVKG